MCRVISEFGCIDSVCLQGGSRLAVTRDLDLSASDFVQFYLRIGGTNTADCTGAELPSEGVLLQYSTDGGTTWYLLRELHHASYRQPR